LTERSLVEQWETLAKILPRNDHIGLSAMDTSASLAQAMSYSALNRNLSFIDIVPL
jgi:hypothetical protein